MPASDDLQSLREAPVIRRATLPEGRHVEIRVVVPDDPYIEDEPLDTVVVELEDGRVLGVVATPLDPYEVAEAIVLAERLREGLESGALEPSAAGIEATAATFPQ